MDLVSLFISVLALLVSAWGAYRSNQRAGEAIQRADAANKIADGANELAQAANVYASEANVLSKQGVEVSQKDYENRYIPKITFRYGSDVNLITNPPTEDILLGVANEGFLPVRIESIGFRIVGSQATLPIFTRDVIDNTYPRVLPARIMPGEVLAIPIALDNLRTNLQHNSKGPDEEFTIWLMQQTGQYFETDRLLVRDYAGERPPIRMDLHNGPPPPGKEKLPQSGG